MSDLLTTATDLQLQTELVNRLTKQVDQLTQQTDQLKKQVASYDKTIASKRTELTAAIADVNSAHENLAATQAQQQAILNNIDKLKQSISTTQKAADDTSIAAKAELDKLYASIEDVKQSKGTYIDNLDQIIAEKQGTIATMSQTVDAIGHKITDQEKAVELKKVDLANVQDKIQVELAKYDAAIASKKQEVTTIDKNIADLQQQAAQLVAENKKHDEIVAAKYQELKAYEDKLTKFEASLRVKRDVLDKDELDLKIRQRRTRSIENLNEL